MKNNNIEFKSIEILADVAIEVVDGNITIVKTYKTITVPVDGRESGDQ